MTGRTRYGDLLYDASRHILAAGVALGRDRFADSLAAEQAVTAWWDLRRALHQHGRQLFGSDVKNHGHPCQPRRRPK